MYEVRYNRIMTETQEYTTLRELVPQLRLAVQPHLVELGGHLFAKKLITFEQEAELRNESKSEQIRVADLVSMVITKVKLDPANLKIFIDVLKDGGFLDIYNLIRSHLEQQPHAHMPNMSPTCTVEVRNQISSSALPSTGTQTPTDNEVKYACTRAGLQECECRICTSMLNCPSTVVHFPLLNLDERGKEDYKLRLSRETKNIMMQFHGVESGLYNTVHNHIAIEGLRFHLNAVKALRSEHFKGSLFSDYKDQLQAAKSKHDIFVIICNFWSFLDYDLLEHLIEFLGNEDDRERMIKYREKFGEYAKRRIIECPSIEPNDDDKWKNVYIKLDSNYKDVTISELREFRCKVSKITDISDSAIRFCCVKMGCIEVMLQIPCSIKQIIIPLSPEKADMLSQLGVLQFSCLDYVHTTSVSQ